MSTLAAQLADDRFLELAPPSTPPSHDAKCNFDKVKASLHKLSTRVVCVQPLDMEPLPKGTSLFAAILARIHRAINDRPLPTRSAGLLEPGFTESRSVLRLRQFSTRIAQALDSNLYERRSSLDPEQYAEEVQLLENRRLQLPQDLDDVLRQLTSEPTNGTTSHPRTLFLVPIDDVDLNPPHCLELLQLLRTFSPPRELFFLLMGQYSIVEHCVQQKTENLHKASGEAPIDLHIRTTATLNLRKMIPQHARCTLPERLTITDAYHFSPLLENTGKAPTPLLALLQEPLQTPHKTSEDGLSLADLLMLPRKNDANQTSDHLAACDWRTYCGPQILSVTYRRLADLWMDINIHKNHHSGNENVLAPVRRFLEAGLALDATISDEACEQLKHRTYHCCQQDTSRLAELEWNLAVKPIEDNTPHSTTGNQQKADTETYTAWIQLTKPTPKTGIPKIPKLPLNEVSIPDKRENGRTPAAPVCYDDHTSSILAVLHDLNYFFHPDAQAEEPEGTFTSERPIRLSWWGTEGQAATFEWPLPPLKTYAETSRFLNAWHHHANALLKPNESTNSNSESATHTDAGIPNNTLKRLLYTWVILGTEATIRCTEEELRDPTRIMNTTDSITLNTESNEYFSNTLLKLLTHKRLLATKRRYAQLNIVEDWIHRLITLAQPEFVTPEVSSELLSGLDNDQQSWLIRERENRSKAIKSERERRLKSIWKRGNRVLWHKLNHTTSGQTSLGITLDHPQPYTKANLRTDMQESRAELQQTRAELQSKTEALRADFSQQQSQIAQITAMLESNRAEQSHSEAKTNQTLDMLVARMQDLNRLLSAQAKPDSMNENSTTPSPKTRITIDQSWIFLFSQAEQQARRTPSMAVDSFKAALNSCSSSINNGTLDARQARDLSRNSFKKTALELIRNRETHGVNSLTQQYFSHLWTTPAPTDENTPEIIRLLDDIFDLVSHIPMSLWPDYPAIFTQAFDCSLFLLPAGIRDHFRPSSPNLYDYSNSTFYLSMIAGKTRKDRTEGLLVSLKMFSVLAFAHSLDASPIPSLPSGAHLFSLACVEILAHCDVLLLPQDVRKVHLITAIAQIACLCLESKRRHVVLSQTRDELDLLLHSPQLTVLLTDDPRKLLDVWFLEDFSPKSSRLLLTSLSDQVIVFRRRDPMRKWFAEHIKRHLESSGEI